MLLIFHCKGKINILNFNIKTQKMADMMNVPVLGLVENMSDYECPDCGKKIKVFGESHIDEIVMN